MTAPRSVLVVGAGIAGLVAARHLRAGGLAVTVVEQGPKVGGRLATEPVGAGRADAGAQFFTVRSTEFAGRRDEWVASGVAREWCRGFSARPDGHPRYIGTSGMAGLADAVAAGLDVRCNTIVTALRSGLDGGWIATGAGGANIDDGAEGPLGAGAVICTAPVPQTISLLAAGHVEATPEARRVLDRVRYEPTVAALVTFDTDTAVPAPGGVQLGRADTAGGMLAWVGDNRAKGISSVPTLTIHASGPESARRLDDDDATTIAALLEAARPWTGAAAPVASRLVRWRYATPVDLADRRCLMAAHRPGPLVCAGDAFGEAKVEGAVRSGLAAAEAVLEGLA